MRAKIQGHDIPFPLNILKGRLLLCGVSDEKSAEILDNVNKLQPKTVKKLYTIIEDQLSIHSSKILKNFELVNSYERLRSSSNQTPPLVLVLEGASATGKSMLALDLIHYLGSTRFISTDTVRQVLRGIHTKEKYPELYCHTYQAHTKRQSGDESLNPILRGYIAQCEVITPAIIKMTERIYNEGATAIIEGVHLTPGELQHIGMGVIEVLINPNEDTHRSMFITKSAAGKLKTVSKDAAIRTQEFDATRIIQEYMLAKASEHKIPTVPLETYDLALNEIATLILTMIDNIVSKNENGD